MPVRERGWRWWRAIETATSVWGLKDGWILKQEVRFMRECWSLQILFQFLVPLQFLNFFHKKIIKIR